MAAVPERRPQAAPVEIALLYASTKQSSNTPSVTPPPTTQKHERRNATFEALSNFSDEEREEASIESSHEVIESDEDGLLHPAKRPVPSKTSYSKSTSRQKKELSKHSGGSKKTNGLLSIKKF
jgi:hypothetical protein